MSDRFADYMQHLLPAAFKKQKKKNQLLVYFKVIGRMYDALLQSVLRLREETVLATCSPEMLEVFGNDYDMPRMQGETYEMYRRRLQMKALVAETAGTRKGILYAPASAGYGNCTITPCYLTDPERWAEIRINIFTASADGDNPIAFKCVVAEVMKVKKAGTLPHWRFYYPVEIRHTDINSPRAAVRFILCIQFRGDRIYNGRNCYNGGLRYDARRNYGTGTALVNGLRIYTGQDAGNAGTGTKTRVLNGGDVSAAIKSFCSISFWNCALYNGPARYDGALQYDAGRRYGMRAAAADRAGIHTAQAVTHKQCRLSTKLRGRETIKAGYIKNHSCRAENPEPGEKSRMRIHMEIISVCGKIDNVHAETRRNVAYFDGTLRYDGTAKYDALYRKEGIE